MCDFKVPNNFGPCTRPSQIVLDSGGDGMQPGEEVLALPVVQPLRAGYKWRSGMGISVTVVATTQKNYDTSPLGVLPSLGEEHGPWISVLPGKRKNAPCPLCHLPHT